MRKRGKEKTPFLFTDVLIIGSGIAGSTTAIQLADKKIKTILLTNSSDPKESNTKYAQGGIIYKGQGDPSLLEKDIFLAGAKVGNKKAIKILAEEGPKCVEEILIKKIGVKFTKNKKGNLHLTKEAAHSTRRIAHVYDETGKEIEESFIKKIKTNTYVNLLTNHTLIDLITIPHHLKKPSSKDNKNTCVGAYLLNNKTSEVITIISKIIVVATGGIGQVFLRTANSCVAKGDGIYSAFRAGAKIKDMEFVQFHPTSLFHKDVDNLLISEATRGEGGKLKNKKGYMFMNKVDKRGSLAPRDIVTRSIFTELINTGEKYVLLDLHSYIKRDEIKKKFPHINNICLKYGIDITKESIPIAPTAHFFCGGINVDSFGRTNIKNLFAIGECSCTGIHGANRLASTSLLECLVWGNRCAQKIIKNINKNKLLGPKIIRHWVYTHKEEEIDPALIEQDWTTIKSIMWNYVGIIRTPKRLKRAIKDLMYLQYRINSFYKDNLISEKVVGLRNGVGVALLIAKAAFKNKKSRGSHYIIKKYSDIKNI